MKTRNRNYKINIFILTFTFGLMFCVVGCKGDKKQTSTPPNVTVSKVIKKTVPIYYEYVGNTESVRTVDITARVEGFLIERAFEDGQDVKQRDLLFVIDPRSFEASLEQSKAQLERDKASLNYALQQVVRYKPLVERDYITKDNYEEYKTQAAEAAATVEADEAEVIQAELNLSYCYMYAPFSGMIGRRLVDVGNLVGAGQDTKLATLVQLDPIYVYFSPTEREIPILMEQFKNDKLRANVILPDEKIHPFEGYVDFIDNMVDQDTGTLTMRAVIPNSEKALLPGQYAQIRLFIKEQPNSLLVPEKAINEGQGGMYVFVVNDKKIVQNVSVTTGPTYKGNVVISKGLKEGQMVIIDGMQKVKQGMKVKPNFAEKSSDKKSDVDYKN
ncbi:MAG: efflux RND transporter periplasmic adaptor subunit [Thermodesulfobacteriota bacterium]